MPFTGRRVQLPTGPYDVPGSNRVP
jgi:hypothetical protein